MTSPAVSPAWVVVPSEAEIRPLLGPFPYDFGFLPAMIRLIAAHEGIAPAFAGLFGQLMFGPGHLDRREREMIAAVASAAQDCHY